MTLNPSDGRRLPRLTPVLPPSRSREISYLDRIDPLHEVEYKDVVTSRWNEISTIQHALTVSASGSLVHGSKRQWSPVAISPARLYTPVTIRSVAALTQFHQMSSLQLATISGGSIAQTEAAMNGLFAAGIVERSNTNTWAHAQLDGRHEKGVGQLWQMHPKAQQVSEWMDGLSDLEFALLSGGRDMSKSSTGSTGSSSIRHNMTLAEIVLRAMELCPGTVGGWGEPLTNVPKFTDTFNHIKKSGPNLALADGVVVGKDGSIILIETSGHANLTNAEAGDRLSKKAQTWAAVAARTDLPLKVIFVNIAPKASMQRFYWLVQNGLDGVGKYIVKEQSKRKGRESIFVADAMDWFPFTLGISEGFTELEAYSTETKRFHSVLPADTKIAPQEDIIANTLGALHTPTWIVN